MSGSIPRSSNIELCRIVAIYFIIAFHCAYKSGFEFLELDANTFIIKVFWLFGELGVNLFMVISGYFMVKSKFRVRKLILLIFEVFFYYLATYIVAASLGVYDLPQSKAGWFQLFFPTIMNKYWYATAYILIYCLSPWLNKSIHAMKQRDLLGLCGVLFAIWSLIPTFFGVFVNSTEGHLYYNRFIWFVVMYYFGAYLRLYPPKLIKSRRMCSLSFVVSFALMCLAIVVIAVFQDMFSKIGLKEWAYFWQPNSLLMFICSVSLFGIFLNLKIPPSRIINKIASTTLGIYLLHDSPLQFFIWKKTLFNLAAFQHSPLLPLLMILCSILVFLVGIAVDLVRQLLEKKILIRVLDSEIIKSIRKMCYDWIDGLLSRIEKH